MALSTPKKWMVAAVSAVIAGGLTWQFWPSPSAAGLVIDAGDAALVAQGRAIYGRECAACHGANLQGQPNWRERGPDGLLPAPPHDETGHTWHHSDGQLFLMTREGIAALAPPGYRTAMPGYKDKLSDREIISVIAYIKSTWPQLIRQRQAEITKRSNQSAQ